MTMQTTNNTDGLLAKGIISTADVDMLAYTIPSVVPYEVLDTKCLNISTVPVLLTISATSDVSGSIFAQDYLEYKAEIMPGCFLERSCELFSPSERIYIKANVANAIAVRITGLAGVVK